MTRFLQRVSFSGADDQTSIGQMLELTKNYPFVEWAILYSPHQQRTARNPSKEWRDSFLDSLSHFYNGRPTAMQRRAVHLCGKLAFYQLLAGSLPGEIKRYGRIQLNVNARGEDFTNTQVLEIYEKALKLGPDIILQASPQTEDMISVFLGRVLPEEAQRIHVLNDSSKGLGIVPDNWYSVHRPQGCLEGFAGGLGPDTIVANLPKLADLEVPHWIDMETGVRTNNQFDLGKVEKVLQLCRPWIA